MTIFCGPPDSEFGQLSKSDLRCVLYGSTEKPREEGTAGATLLKLVQHSNQKLAPSMRAWDLLSIALSVTYADTAKLRKESPDGWTRQIELVIAVYDPDFWNVHKELIEDQLKFLTTDIWQLEFTSCKLFHETPEVSDPPGEDCVTLLSGGLDSFIGAIDLVESGKKPYAVSHVSSGSKRLQLKLASEIGGKLNHLQLNHNAKCPGEREISQRVRSIIFLAYGVLVATALQRYKDDQNVDLYMSENGLISINPALTPARLGSLSTRTTHPIFIDMFQKLLNATELKVTVKNPYQFKTKGEMLLDCKDQGFLAKYATKTISCSRYARHGWKHCGRCVPCLIRRAAFHTWGSPDETEYFYRDLSKNDHKHAHFDDVRCTAMATILAESDGIDALPSTNLNALRMGDLAPYKGILTRGMKEIGNFLSDSGVK